MASITKDQIQDIKTLVRRANRRIERSKGGQRRYLESVVARVTGGQEKFSAAYKGLSETAAAHKIAQLNRFLGAISTTIVGWDIIKMEIVHKARLTLDKENYNLTDEELADILMQIDGKSSEDYYRAINLVQAAKEKDPGREFNYDEIADIIAQKDSAEDALKNLLKIREAKR